jgi:hypothetical protein
MKNLRYFSFISGLLLSHLVLSSLALAQPSPSEGMGRGLYSADGANSCLFCHGILEESGTYKVGNIKDAAKLSEPKTWNVYAALGGEAAFKKDPKGFVAKMKDATIHLIRMGAIRHNATYKADGYDKSLRKSYNAQMMGLSGAASVAWLNRMKAREVTPEIAAESLWLFIKTFDQQGVFKAAE